MQPDDAAACVTGRARDGDGLLRARPTTTTKTVSWQRTIVDLGGAQANELATLARACADGPLALPSELDLARRVAELEAVLDTPACDEHVTALVEELRAARALPERLVGDALAEECAPWAARARVEAQAGLAALRLIDQVKAPNVDPERAMHHAFAVLYLWSGARADGEVVYGPRFALYTPVIQLADGAPGLDAAAAVRENANAIDALCRLALATYDRWRVDAGRQAMTAPHVSVVMPAYNEAEILETSVKEVVTGLRERGESFEVLIVENGSTDRTLRSSRKRSRSQLPEVHVEHRADADYGRALRHGLLAATGDAVVNFDIDYFDLDFLDAAVAQVLGPGGPAIVVGSKRARRRAATPASRCASWRPGRSARSCASCSA